jgi:DNA adenine methylase
LFPPHRCYVEPFAGGLSILLNKTPADDYVGDLNPDLINFWRVLRDGSCKFPRLLDMLEYSEKTFEWAASPAETPFEQAARFLVRNRFSRGGLGKDFAWSDRLRGGQPGDANAWDTIREELPAIIERLQGVGIQEKDALQLIHESPKPDTLIYCDPPYLHETRTAKKAYTFEMTASEHEQMLVMLLDSKAMIALSGYRSALYDDALSDWRRIEFSMPNHSGQGKSKQRRVECVWMNYPEQTP